MDKLLVKELGSLEDLLDLLEFLKLAACQLQFFFLFRDVFAKPVDLVKDDVHRGLFLPRLPLCLG